MILEYKPRIERERPIFAGLTAFRVIDRRNILPVEPLIFAEAPCRNRRHCCPPQVYNPS